MSSTDNDAVTVEFISNSVSYLLHVLEVSGRGLREKWILSTCPVRGNR